MSRKWIKEKNKGVLWIKGVEEETGRAKHTVEAPGGKIKFCKKKKKKKKRETEEREGA